MPQAQVLLILEGANADELWCDTLVTDRYGSVHGEILLPEDVLTGTWRLSAGVMNGDDCDAEDSRSLMVSEYKRPQFEVSCNSIKGSFSFGDTVTVTGKAITFREYHCLRPMLLILLYANLYIGAGMEVRLRR